MLDHFELPIEAVVMLILLAVWLLLAGVLVGSVRANVDIIQSAIQEDNGW